MRQMITYEVTVTIVLSERHDEWLEWMQEVHIPDLMKTGLFVANRMYKDIQAGGENTYIITYDCRNRQILDQYLVEFAPALKADHAKKFAGAVTATRRIMERLN